MIRYIIVILFINFCFLDIVSSQESPALNLTVKDGLPSNNIYGIFSDSKGYLWIGTDKGCAKFNGRTFEVFTTSDGLPDNEVFNIREDGEGRYWLSTFKGSLSFYKGGKFYTSSNTPWLTLPPSISSFIGIFSIESDGTLWAVNGSGSHYLRIKGNHLTLIELTRAHSLSGSMPRPHYVAKKNNNRYLVYYTRSIVEIDSTGTPLSRSAYAHNMIYGTGNSARSFFMFSKNGIFEFTSWKSSFMPASRFPAYRERFNDTSNTLLYINGNDLFFSRKYVTPPGHDRILPDSITLTFVEKDYSGNLWAGTRGNGLYCVGRNAAYINRDTSKYGGTVLRAEAVAGSIYFVTSDGKYNLYRDSRLWDLTTFKSPTQPASPGNFLILNNGDLLQIFQNFNFIYKISANGNIESKKLDLPYKIAATSTKDIFEYAGFIYISSISNLLRLNARELNMPNQHWESLVYSSLNDNDNDARIYARAIDPKDTSIWLSRADGVYRIRGRHLQRQPQFHNTRFRRITFQGPYCVGFTENNKLFISASYSSKKFQADTISYNGCIWETIFPIDAHHIVIGTNKYYLLLSLLAPLPNGRPNYNVRVIEEPFLPQQAEYIVPDGNFCYFFKDGYITRVARQVLMQTVPPPISVFSGFIAASGAKPVAAQITITYPEASHVSILFDNTSYVSNEIATQYSISENSTDKWVDITGNEINLNSPGYGTFTIKVRSKTLSSAYSRPAVLILKIERPFWATWWFVTLCILALLGIIWGIILLVTWRKLRKKQKEHEADMKFQQSEYKALNALMNPHFIFNSLNNIQGLINKDEKRTANEYLVIFSDLVRQNMHNISKGFISLQEELTLIENYLTLEKLRFKELVNYNIKIEEDVDVDDIMIPPLMIQPLVENAVKHGLLPMQSASARVSIEVYEREDMLYIIVEDNGIGLTASLKSQNKLHESFGLSNLQKRTDHLKKIQQHELNIEVNEMKDSDGMVLGTKAVVTIRLN